MRLEHPIFHTPHQVQVPLHELAVPEHYAHYSLEPQPATLPGWKVFERPAPPPGAEPDRSLALVGLVSDGFGFSDSPDCEWISSGINSKGPDALAIGRQASYFLWGFAADPSLFTPSARDVFVNAVVYMQQFDGQRPLVRAVASPREWVGVEVWAAAEAGRNPAYRDPGEDPEQAVTQALTRYFGAATVARVGSDPEAMRAWMVDHLEQVTSVEGEDGRSHHAVDEDLVELGASNRRLELFDRVLERWRRDPGDALCQRVLGRYVPDEAFAAPDELARWVAEHRERLFFSDTGGFRWFVVGQEPRGAARGAPAGVGDLVDGEHVRMRAVLALPQAGEDLATLSIRFEIEAGWHGYAATSAAGAPLRPRIPLVLGFELEGEMSSPPASSVHDTPQGQEAWLTGSVTYEQKLRPLTSVPDKRVRVVASVVVCDEQRCLPPQPLELTLELPR